MSLRRVSSGHIESSGFWIFATHRFFTTKREHFTLSNGEFRSARKELDARGVTHIGDDGDRVLWWTKQGLFWADDDLDVDDVELLVWDRSRRQGSRLERLRKIRAREQGAQHGRRERIPKEVRAFAWQRDDGRCTSCGAEDDLQFDHIIPVARGGGNAVANIQILCGDCNRLKSDSIA